MTPIGSNPDQVEYRLGGGHGCRDAEHDRRFSYHTDGRERPLRWVGKGLAEVGILAGSELTEEQFDIARGLLNGVDPRSGEQLVRHKLAVPRDAKVPLAPLVAAVREKATRDGVAPMVLMDSDRTARMLTRAERQVETLGEAALLRADDAGAMAAAAGLSPAEVWADGEHDRAVANLTRAEVVDDGRGGIRTVVVPRRVVAGNLGYDVSFTLPKSHSLLLAFAEEETAARVEDLYAAKVAETFDWLEAQTAYGMRGHHGDGRTARVVQGSGFLGWTMTHRSARPVDGREVGDPHWHVHATIANMTKGRDGRWSTVAAGGRDLMRHAPAVDHVLKALVRAELVETFGVEFARSRRTGAWEVAAIPDEVLVAFSKRGASIDALLRDLGFDPQVATAKAERIAEAQTRGAKLEIVSASDATLRELWQAEARAHGTDPAGLARDAFAGAGGPGLVERGRVDVARVVAEVTDPERGLTSSGRRFTRVELLAAVADALPAGARRVEDIEAVADQVLQHPAFVSLGEARHNGTPGRLSRLESAHMRNADRWTTADVTAAETLILDAAAASSAGQARTRVLVDPEVARMAQSTIELTQGHELNPEQASALMQLVCSDRQVDALVGGPGTGKTTLMRAARAAWEAHGFTVAGAATAAVAAQNLRDQSGIASLTVAQWLLVSEANTAAGRAPLADVDVLVLDEANLTDDRARQALYAAAIASGTKVVEVGDPRQLRGVGCGSLFGEVHRIVDGPQLVENRRQLDVDERSILAAWREGRHVDALTRWRDKGRVVATETVEESVTAMVRSWLTQRQGAPDPHTEIRGLVMLAATNEQVERINHAAQAVRQAAGELGEGRRYRTAAGHDMVLHEGDHVLLRVNDRRQRMHEGGPGVLNGYRGVIERIDQAGHLHVAWRHDADTPDPADPGSTAGGRVHRARLSPEYVARGGVQLGYAMTLHKAEGLTVAGSWDRADGTRQQGSVLFHAAGADEAGLYVAMTRHRDKALLFAAREQLESDQTTYVQGRPPDAAERSRRVVAALATRARATREDPDDMPVVRDLGRRDEPTTRTQAPPPLQRAIQPRVDHPHAEQADAAPVLGGGENGRRGRRRSLARGLGRERGRGLNVTPVQDRDERARRREQEEQDRDRDRGARRDRDLER